MMFAGLNTLKASGWNTLPVPRRLAGAVIFGMPLKEPLRTQPAAVRAGADCARVAAHWCSSMRGGERILARITRRSAETLGLAEGVECFAILKSVAVAKDDIGAG